MGSFHQSLISSTDNYNNNNNAKTLGFTHVQEVADEEEGASDIPRYKILKNDANTDLIDQKKVKVEFKDWRRLNAQPRAQILT